MKNRKFTSPKPIIEPEHDKMKYIMNANQQINQHLQSNSTEKFFTFQDLLTNMNKCLELNPQIELSTSQSMKLSEINKDNCVQNNCCNKINNLKKIDSLVKLCKKLFEVCQELNMKLQKYENPLDFSNIRQSLISTISQKRNQNQDRDQKIIQLQNQITACKQTLEKYQKNIEKEIFQKQVQNQRYQQKIAKLQATVALQRQNYSQCNFKMEMVYKNNQSLKSELNQLKYSASRKQINSSYQKSDISSKTPKNSDKQIKNSLSIQSIDMKSQSFYKKVIQQLQETVQSLNKQLQIQKKTISKLQDEYHKAMEFTLECQKQLNIKNQIIFQLTNNRMILQSKFGENKRQLSYAQINQFNQSKASSVKKSDQSRISQVVTLDVPLRIWKNGKPVNLINLLNDQLQIAWIDKIKVIFKLVQFFEQKQSWLDTDQISVEEFSAININQNRFLFSQTSNRNILTPQGKEQCLNGIRINFITILDKLLQIPQQDILPRQIRLTINQLSSEVQQIDQYDQSYHANLCKRLKSFCLESLQDHQ